MATKRKTQQVPAPADLVADGRRWRKVRAPKPWKPKDAGEKIIGVYLGQQLKSGIHGQYVVFAVHTEEGETLQVSGTVATNLFGSALLEEGQVVRVVFNGERAGSQEGKFYRDFDLFVEVQ